jgi:hypothetical protein
MSGQRSAFLDVEWTMHPSRVAAVHQDCHYRHMGDPILDWLTDGDPAIRWQTERDLLQTTPEIWVATRSEVGRAGWGKRLLDRQDSDGAWGNGLYSPKWTSTTYTLLLLRRLGLPPSNSKAIAGCQKLLDDADWINGGVSLFKGQRLAEKCINGMILSLVSYFDVPDVRADVDNAIASGQEFMLRHQMFLSHRTGEVINEAWTTFHFPPRWHYEVMRGMDHLQDAGAQKDHRAARAMELVRPKRRKDGLWDKGPQYSGKVFFVLEPGRAPGRWNTLRALRVLSWWSGQVSSPPL